MIVSRGSRLLAGAVSRPGARWASYIKPKFEGGKAKPHELGKTIRQRVFEKGEYYLSIPAFLVIAIITVFSPHTKRQERFIQDRFDEWRTLFCYPYPERDESD